MGAVPPRSSPGDHCHRLLHRRPARRHQRLRSRRHRARHPTHPHPRRHRPPGYGTGHYAHVHDATIRDEFDRYQAQRINISGDRIAYDAEAPTASAEWVKHNLNRVRDSLPNGYCGRPPQQDCPHPNACLTCPDFQTTPQFLDIHRRQARTNLRLITRADANGQTRLAENLRRVQTNLDNIIPALEAIHDEPGDDQG
jgi:hypothetical protein